ncbi:unnamed protein product [Cuscuta epithymum]|uniref:Peptidase A1 domain-containing protein n=2 Tax=Cuscuta epithymum TaxID=186058 RepID=A0AAV0FQY2_9ASTE|nr:unnamed protein product [Cuscuta epithymum]CAH9138058.1 unnamed protein product [Cuscuta epithymum]
MEGQKLSGSFAHSLLLTVVVFTLVCNGQMISFNVEKYIDGAVDLPLGGSFDVGMYYTKIYLGSPSKEFLVQIDTGSDGLWVNCISCKDCEHQSMLEVHPSFFDPSTSSTSSFIPCSDDRICTGDGFGCSSQNRCTYTYHYIEGSWALVDYVTDLIHLGKYIGTSTINTSTPINFGCATHRQGAESRTATLDGVLGLGNNQMSAVNQLAAKGVIPSVFSHCFKRSGGGSFVLGQVAQPNVTYTPMVPGANYRVELQSIYINEQPVPIDPQVFGTSNGGTLIDSGTTMGYIVMEAYDPFVNAINQVVSSNVYIYNGEGRQCYASSSSVFTIFPSIRLNFAGGASMVLQPIDYLIHEDSVDGTSHWCLGFSKSEKKSVLGGSQPIDVSISKPSRTKRQHPSRHFHWTIILLFVVLSILLFLLLVLAVLACLNYVQQNMLG